MLAQHFSAEAEPSRWDSWWLSRPIYPRAKARGLGLSRPVGTRGGWFIIIPRAKALGLGLSRPVGTRGR